MRCYHCEIGVTHPWHDGGTPADPILCEDISNDWGDSRQLLARRDDLCGKGFCLCDIVERQRNGSTTPRPAG